MGDVDSNMVLWGQTVLYTIYALVTIAVVAWFAYRVTHPRPPGPVKTGLFWTFFALLVVGGVSLHLTTAATIPWVEQEINRSDTTPDKTFAIVARDHRFELPAMPLAIDCDDTVLFKVTSEDLTYGFGLFRRDHSMVFQMQVVPGHPNDLLWTFKNNGLYSIRSTEYSGPAGARMGVADAVSVTGCGKAV
ncbi:MAG: cytochrome C oxidase subunit II [Actinobacteria bacterium]|nr:cytochrome C oxidase subunit II [Thermoleophilia bacterium]MCB9011420.1 cytochrome C oxidase subunit II [Actinomycetota bacterium]